MVEREELRGEDTMNSKLQDMVRHAFETVPFYMNYGEENGFDVNKPLDEDQWGKIPILHKDDMVCNPNQYYSRTYLMPIINRQLEMCKTSGSTGKCFEVYWDLTDVRRSLLPLWAYRKKDYGILPSDSQCYFFSGRTVSSEEVESETFGNQHGFCKANLSHEKLRGIYKRIQEINPRFMYLQPSMAQLIVQCAKKEGLGNIPNLKYIELTGEMMLDTDRRDWEDFFQCRTSNQYGASEVNSIAFECKNGHMHIMGTNVFVEIVKDGDVVSDGEEGGIHVTSLHSHAMPLIKYDIGDSGIIRRDIKCNCGNPNPILELKKGRKNDWIWNKDGSKVSAYTFVRAVNNVNIVLDNVIKQFQIEQNDFDKFLVKLVIDDEMGKEAIVEVFVDNVLQSSLSQAQYRFEFYNALFPDDVTGKLKFFHNKMEGN